MSIDSPQEVLPPTGLDHQKDTGVGLISHHLGMGVSGTVELLPSGDVLKKAHTATYPGEEAILQKDLQTEAQIYELLGEHSHVVGYKGWDVERNGLILEYMQNGRLDEYLESQADISREQMLHWAGHAIICVELLHSKDIIHYDFRPSNLLLDRNLNLRICDFAGSSFKGSPATVLPPERYCLPELANRNPSQITNAVDVFGLGSTLYQIFTRTTPLKDMTSEQVEDEFRLGRFPNVSHLPCGDIIESCWRESTQPIQEIREKFDSYLSYVTK